MVDEDYVEMRKRRTEREARMRQDMDRAMGDTAELERVVTEHPLPWTWTIAFHDHLFYQIIDANGRPVLGNDLTDPDDAAFLLTMINRLAHHP